MQLKKVVIIGPESTGKSTLCEDLSRHFQTDWVKEYARAYLLENGTDYTYEDLLDIAKGQLGSEDEQTENFIRLHQESNNSLPIFMDTDMYVMKVWCEFVFGKCHPWILNQIVDRKYDLYLLCNTDVPWVKDELREYPDLVTREKLFRHYKDIMVNQRVPWVEIRGNYEERLKTAVAAVNNIL